MENGFRPSIESQSTLCAGRINQYALVAYIEGELGDFLLRLRQEIVPGCQLRSHVSILPPRLLPGSEADAEKMLRETARDSAAFEVVLGAVEVFPVTNVVYVAVAQGGESLHRMHDQLNSGSLAYAEPFAYHPHITLAQEIPTAHHAEALSHCEERWKTYTGPRAFPVETLTFVQNTPHGWTDLTSARLTMAGSRR